MSGKTSIIHVSSLDAHFGAEIFNMFLFPEKIFDLKNLKIEQQREDADDIEFVQEQQLITTLGNLKVYFSSTTFSLCYLFQIILIRNDD